MVSVRSTRTTEATIGHLEIVVAKKEETTKGQIKRQGNP